MFVPQGMNVTTDYPFLHPEYIMATRYYGSPESEGNGTNSAVSGVRNPLKIKTRLFDLRFEGVVKVLFLF